ncbi:uncharacterized protein MYCFIDRAFT_169485 [Pseudocercospora fijiensis CIRAD86]|uniref:Uncharacterized protein n=1 Tax=Pseudocercospora fijiensis (strain CIRAD86) TaxID=383855 RepID=N1Q9Z6_PSEFD|nr:uncharacterized protein MYCFIDRAFT_169485 [Pseudocercospora fijiensis CIRAD86]EME87713.1 hypothetical protein MYCFIDRAFT_169485 [Pseudocercospora fijiensis CIRAD86]
MLALQLMPRSKQKTKKKTAIEYVSIIRLFGFGVLRRNVRTDGPSFQTPWYATRRIHHHMHDATTRHETRSQMIASHYSTVACECHRRPQTSAINTVARQKFIASSPLLKIEPR